MQDRGFTLVELIAVIIILGIVALIVTPVVTDVIKDSREKLYNHQVEEVLRSAERWAMSNNILLPVEDQAIYYLSIPSLKDDGFVKDSDIVNPITNENMNGCILMTYQADSMQYDYKYEEVACSSTHTVDNLTNVYPEYACYTFDSATGTITNYDATNPICVTNVFIPNKIDGVDVLIIGTDAFRNKNITNVKLPNNIVTIGANAFAENVLVSLDLSNLENLITIGDHAFAYNTIASLNLTGLTNLSLINYGAFIYNSITSLNFIGLNNLKDIEEEAFQFNIIASLNITDLPKLEQIHLNAFSENSITSLTLENLPLLNDIEDAAFAYNHMTNLVLKNLPGVSFISDCAFRNNSLTTINLQTLPQLVSINYQAFKNNSITSLNLSGLPNLTTIESEAFYGNRLSNITIPASVTTIAANAFYQSGSYPWSSVTIGYNATNLRTRFNATWTGIGWPAGLMPSS